MRNRPVWLCQAFVIRIDFLRRSGRCDERWMSTDAARHPVRCLRDYDAEQLQKDKDERLEQAQVEKATLEEQLKKMQNELKQTKRDSELKLQKLESDLRAEQCAKQLLEQTKPAVVEKKGGRKAKQTDGKSTTCSVM